MIKKIFVVFAMMGVMLPSFAFAAFGLEGASQDTGLIKGGQAIDATKTVPELIGTIVGVALSFVGAIFFLLILYAGFLWMTAFGSSEKADKAKGILEHAAIGLVIVLAAYAISRFVFTSITEETSGGSPVSSAACPIGSIDGATVCGPRKVCDCEDKFIDGVCETIGRCIDKCEYRNITGSTKNYVCTDVSAIGGECPGGRIKEIGWCASPSANVVCCHDP